MRTIEVAVYVTDRGPGTSPMMDASTVRFDQGHPGFNKIRVNARDRGEALLAAIAQIRNAWRSGAEGINIDYRESER